MRLALLKLLHEVNLIKKNGGNSGSKENSAIEIFPNTI